MRKFKLTKLITSVLVAALVMVLSPIGASAQWKQDSIGWRYTEGNSYATSWRTIDGKWYYFDSNGYRAHDTTIEGYKLGSDGALIPNRLPASAIAQLAACADNQSAAANTSKGKMVEVTVSNAKEFVDAIGSNKRILLKPGVYNLSNINQINKADNSVTWKDVYSQKELNLYNIHNLTIEGMAPGQVEINIDPRDAVVMGFNNASNITIKNIIAGHTPEPYHCNAGVLSFYNSTDISIINSELYGCGSIGLSLNNVKRLNSSNCIIDHCSFEAVTIRDSQDIKFTANKIIDHEAYGNIIDIKGSNNIIFEKCELSGNNNFEYGFIKAAGSYGLRSTGSKGAPNASSNGSNVLLDKCIIKNNSEAAGVQHYNTVYFFNTDAYNGISKSKITVRDSEISGNKCDYLKDNSESVKFENCTVNNNVW